MDSRYPSKKDIETYGGDIKTVYTRWKLLEWSIAPVQSNPEAVVTDIGKALNPTVAKSLYGVEARPVPAVKRVLYVLMQPEPQAKRLVMPDMSESIHKAIAKARGKIYG